MALINNIGKLSILILLVFLAESGQTQVAPNKYWIQFTDKLNSPYSISNPAQYLSQKAIDRRLKQNIPILENDIPVNPAYFDSILSTGVLILNPSKWFNGITISSSDTAALMKIKSFPFVKSISKVAGTEKKSSRSGVKNFEYQDILFLDRSRQIPNISYGRQNFLNPLDYGLGFRQVNMISVNILHEMGFKGEGIIIAVLDAGFTNADKMLVFDSLRINSKILGDKDFVSKGGNIYSGSTHGSVVLSTMAANSSELIGTSPQAFYYLLRSEDIGSEFLIEEYNWASAAEFADSTGADIINSSLGYTDFDDSLQNHTYADMDGNTTIVTIAADIAASKGMIVVNSAGNSGNSAWKYIGAPADGDSVLAVGAVNVMGVYAKFSSVGPSFDRRIKPDIASQGQNAVISNINNQILTGNGTSFASPIVAGAVACLWQAHPNRTNMEIINAIKESSNKTKNPDSLTGYGIPNFALANLYLHKTKINNIDDDRTFSIFPNPFTNSFQIIFNSNYEGNLDIEFYTITGIKVFEKKSVQKLNGMNYFLVNNLTYLDNGIYFVKVKTNTTSVLKVVKME